MALATVVNNNTQIGGNGVWTDPNGHPPYNFATSCHFATCYWAFLDEFGRVPTQAELLKIGSAQTFISGLLPHATRLNRPGAGSLMLTQGSALLFVDGNVAGHSCIATAAQTVAGYNQMGWYTLGGVDHGFSTHTTNMLMWGAGGNASRVRRTQSAGWYELYSLPEAVLRASVRGKVQG
ncbi:MAG: hypothetical protein SFV54_25345 [Bryobacteraceae bacterium]|nr:hypothetical protein [Bryobacteraceae bacterium]